VEHEYATTAILYYPLLATHRAFAIYKLILMDGQVPFDDNGALRGHCWVITLPSCNNQTLSTVTRLGGWCGHWCVLVVNSGQEEEGEAMTVPAITMMMRKNLAS